MYPQDYVIKFPFFQGKKCLFCRFSKMKLLISAVFPRQRGSDYFPGFDVAVGEGELNTYFVEQTGILGERESVRLHSRTILFRTVQFRTVQFSSAKLQFFSYISKFLRRKIYKFFVRICIHKTKYLSNNLTK